MKKNMAMMVCGYMLSVCVGSTVFACAMDDGDQQSLHEAISQKNIDEVRRLIEEKADVNKCVERYGFPLEVAIEGTDEQIVTVLLKAQADVNARYPGGTTLNLLPLAVTRHSTLSLMAKLIDAKADVNGLDDFYNTTPLLDALAHKRPKEVVAFLLEHRADPELKVGERDTPLDVIANDIRCTRTPERLEMQQLLQSYSKSAQRREIPLIAAASDARDDGDTPLHQAIRKKDGDVVRKLIDEKADVNECDGSATGIAPISLAILLKYNEIIPTLIEAKAEVDVYDKRGLKPLFYVIQWRTDNASVAQMLIDAKADVTTCDQDGISPLVEAIRRKQTAIATKLVEAKADVRAKFTGESFKGWTPLYLAVTIPGQDIVMFKMLLDNGADPDEVIDGRLSAMRWVEDDIAKERYVEQSVKMRDLFKLYQRPRVGCEAKEDEDSVGLGYKVAGVIVRGLRSLYLTAIGEE